MNDLNEQGTQGADRVQKWDLKRLFLGIRVDSRCPVCGVYSGQLHHPDCKYEAQPT